MVNSMNKNIGKNVIIMFSLSLVLLSGIVSVSSSYFTSQIKDSDKFSTGVMNVDIVDDTEINDITLESGTSIINSFTVNNNNSSIFIRPQFQIEAYDSTSSSLITGDRLELISSVLKVSNNSTCSTSNSITISNSKLIGSLNSMRPSTSSTNYICLALPSDITSSQRAMLGSFKLKLKIIATQWIK